MNISDEIRKAMQQQGINASDLAKEIGISRCSIWRKLNGHTDFTLKEIKKAAKALSARRKPHRHHTLKEIKKAAKALNIPFLQLMESADGAR